MNNNEIKFIPLIKKYINKAGEEVTKTYNQKLYNNNYYQKNKDKVNTKIQCEACQIPVNKSNYSNHKKSQRHKYYEAQSK